MRKKELIKQNISLIEQLQDTHAQIKELKKEADYDSLYKELTTIIKELHYLGENEENIENIIRNIYREEK